MITLLISFVVFLIPFIFGIISTTKYFKHTSKWEGNITNEEYWTCLLWGWCSLMLFILCGFALFVIATLIIFTFIL